MGEAGTRVNKLKGCGALAFEALREWVRDRCSGLAAALAFNWILAVAPFIACIVILATALFGAAWTRSHIVPVVLAWVGPQGAEVLRFMLVNEKVDMANLLPVSVIGAIGLLLGASGFFVQLQDSLQTIWDIRREVARIPVQLKKHLYLLFCAMVSALIALAGFVLSALIIAVRAGPPLIPNVPVAEALVAFLTFWALVMFWLKMLLPVPLTFRQIMPWATFIAAMHLLGRLVLTWSAAGQKGAATDAMLAQSLLLFLLWFYYACMVLLYGAQLMRLSLLRAGTVSMPPGGA